MVKFDKSVNIYSWIKFASYFCLFTFVIFLDRITKSFAIGLENTLTILKNFIYFQTVLNNGISWGLFSSQDLNLNSIVAFIIMLLIISIIIYLIKHIYSQILVGKYIFAEILILAGALSNLFDRIYYKGVIDFIVIDFHFWTFPIFNFADIAIVLGSVYLLTDLFLCSKNESSKVF